MGVVNIGPWTDTVAGAITSALADVEANQDQDESFRTAAIRPLGEMGRDAKSAVPLLTKLLENGISTSDVAKALGNIGPDAKPAIPALLRVLKNFAKDSTLDDSDDDGPHVSPIPDDAVEALGKIGPAAVPLLEELLNDKARSASPCRSRGVGICRQRREAGCAGTCQPAQRRPLENSPGCR